MKIDYETATTLNLGSYKNEFKNYYLEYISTYDRSAVPDKNFILNLAKIYNAFDVDISKYHISTTYGTYGAYRLIMQITKTKIIYKTNYGNRSHEKAFELYGAYIEHINSNINDCFPSIEVLNKLRKNTTLYVNATDGRMPSEDYFKELYSIVRTRGLNLIIDCDSQFIRHREGTLPIKNFLQEDIPDNIYILCTLSKEFGMPGLRYGYIITTKATGEALDKFKYIGLEMEPYFVKKVASEIITIERLRLNVYELEKRAQHLEIFLDSNNINYIKPDTGVNYFIETKSPTVLRDNLRKRNILVSDGNTFGLFQNYIRWTLAQDSEIQSESLRILKEGLDS